MIKINAISNEYKQNFNQNLPNNKAYNISMRYIPDHYAWYLDLFYENKQYVAGKKLCIASNILKSQELILPYGIAILDDNNNNFLEPWFLNSFTYTTSMYIVNNEDIEYIKTYLS